MRIKKYLNSPVWPKVKINVDNFDGNIPSTRVKNWQQLIALINNGKISDQNDEVLFRGQRNASWGLVPSIARLSKNGTYKNEVASKQIEHFKYSIRGRTKIPVSQLEDVDVWALGQHYGLWTPLLDWSRSPFVAMFFAMSEQDPVNESPKNYSRAVFSINRTKLIDVMGDDFFINPLSSDHERLISQDGLFTLSPAGEITLEYYIINALAENGVDVDNADVLKDYICKIHIPIHSDCERNNAVIALGRMNLHYANLFPDIAGSSLHCNELLRNIYNSNHL